MAAHFRITPGTFLLLRPRFRSGSGREILSAASVVGREGVQEKHVQRNDSNRENPSEQTAEKAAEEKNK